jgi:hypothetical protein
MGLRRRRDYRVSDGDRRARFFLAVLILVVGYLIVVVIAV